MVPGLRARRFEIHLLLAVESQARARGQLASLDIRSRRADVEHNPVDIGDDGSVRIINPQRDRLGPLRHARPVDRRALAAAVAGVLARDHSLREYRAADGYDLRRVLPEGLRRADKTAAAEQDRQGDRAGEPG